GWCWAAISLSLLVVPGRSVFVSASAGRGAALERDGVPTYSTRVQLATALSLKPETGSAVSLAGPLPGPTVPGEGPKGWSRCPALDRRVSVLGFCVTAVLRGPDRLPSGWAMTGARPRWGAWRTAGQLPERSTAPVPCGGRRRTGRTPPWRGPA